MRLPEEFADIADVFGREDPPVFLERAELGVLPATLHRQPGFAADQDVHDLAAALLPLADRLDQVVLVRVQDVALFAQAPVVLEEHLLGLEVAAEPALDDVDVFRDGGVLALLLFVGGHARPGAAVAVITVRRDARQGAQADHAVGGLGLVLCGGLRYRSQQANGAEHLHQSGFHGLGSVMWASLTQTTRRGA